MEVILKKIKINLSVFNQIMVAGISDFMIYKPLGFCVVKGHKWIVLYNEETNQIRKFLTFKLESESDTSFIIKFPTASTTVKFDSIQEKVESFVAMIYVKDKANELGQFFI